MFDFIRNLSPISWVKKKVIESLVKDIVKAVPTIKAEGLKLIEEHKDEVIEKAKKAIKKAVVDFINSKINNKTKKK